MLACCGPEAVTIATTTTTTIPDITTTTTTIVTTIVMAGTTTSKAQSQPLIELSTSPQMAAASYPPAVTTSHAVTSTSATFTLTRSVTFEGDYATVVGDKVSFLLECSSKLHPVKCIDVTPGSIIVMLESSSRTVLEGTILYLAVHGLALPGFPVLTVQVREDAPSDDTRHESSTTIQMHSTAVPESTTLPARVADVAIIGTSGESGSTTPATTGASDAHALSGSKSTTNAVPAILNISRSEADKAEGRSTSILPTQRIPSRANITYSSVVDVARHNYSREALLGDRSEQSASNAQRPASGSPEISNDQGDSFFVISPTIPAELEWASLVLLLLICFGVFSLLCRSMRRKAAALSEDGECKDLEEAVEVEDSDIRLPTLLTGQSWAVQSLHVQSSSKSSSSCRPFDGSEDFLRGVNHIALVVKDIGLSSLFYTEVLGLKQVSRPNFDRHGAWLSLGNVELHLIKGTPHTQPGQHPHDLIVSHIALAISDSRAVLSRLQHLKRERFPDLEWRQNVSVPTWESSRARKFDADHQSAEGQLPQFFLEDPDGYWIELLECEEDECDHPSGRQEGAKPSRPIVIEGKVQQPVKSQCRFQSIASASKLYLQLLRWKKRAQSRLRAGDEAIAEELGQLVPVKPEDVSVDLLTNFRLRRNTYMDLCQGFTSEELQDTLAEAGNNAAGAVLLLRHKRQISNRPFVPPAYLDMSGQPQAAFFI